MINFVVWLILGGFIGWVASMLMKNHADQIIFLNMLVGIAGAMLGGWLLSPMLGSTAVNLQQFSLAALPACFLGALLLLGVFGLLRRGSARQPRD